MKQRGSKHDTGRKHRVPVKKHDWRRVLRERKRGTWWPRLMKRFCK